MTGRALKSLRQLSGLKAKEVASSLNISTSYLSEIESEKKDPTLLLLGEFSKIYGVRKSTILYLSEEIQDNEYASGFRNNLKDTAIRISKALARDLE